MAVKFSNNAKTLLSSGITSSATSISVSDASAWPTLYTGDYSLATLVDISDNTIFEIVKVTAISSNTLTVARGQEGTTARAFSSGDKVELRLTAGLLEQALTGTDVVKLDSLTASATASYSLAVGGVAYSPANANALIVSLNGVTQEPISAFTVSGSTITFASALTANDSIDYIVDMAKTLDIGEPSDNTVSPVKLTSAVNLDAITDNGATTTNAVTVGDLTANGTVEFDGLSGTGAVTVTDILDQDDMSSNSATALATQQSIKAYVDAQVDTADALPEVLANGNTTGGTDISVSTGDDITFADNSKAIFGAGNDLQVYHDGSNSFIKDAGTGDLRILGSASIDLKNSADGVVMLRATAGGSVQARHNGDIKLQTTASGIDVTGTIGSGTWQGSVISDTYIADDLTISGGTIENTPIGATTPSTAEFTSVDVSGIAQVTGQIRSGTHIIAGQSDLVNSPASNGGEVAMTINDGGGNANLTFNHTSRVPDQNGNAFRITCNTDTSSNAAMLFEVAQGVTAGTTVDTPTILRIDTAGIEVTGETHTDTLDVTKDVASTVIATMSNPNVTASHVLKLTGGGGGSGTKLLECVGGSNGTVFEVLGSGGVNIGGDLLDVGNITSRGVLRGTSTTGAGTPTFSFDGDTNTGMYHVSVDHLGFTTAGTTRCIMDSIGNIGFGTDPTAQGSYRVVELKSTHADAGGYIRLQGTTSTTRASLFNYASTMYLESQGGSFSFRDNSGNVKALISEAHITSQGASNPYLRAMSSSDNNYTAALKVHYAEESMSLTGGQGYKILATDGYSAPNNIKFYASNDEKMRLDNSGNLMIGKTVMAASANGLAVLGESTNAATASLNVSTKNNTNNTTNILVNFRRGGTETTSGTASGAIAVNGTSQAAFVAYSDERLKENIEDLPSQLENIKSLRPCEFDYKDGSGHQIGFIAQEMQEVYSDCVGEDDDGFLTIGGWNKTEARLVKAIQEQQTIIEALTQRIEQLEAK